MSKEYKHKILVAGGAGYIGSHTAVELLQAGFDVLIVDNLSNSTTESIDGIEAITGIRPEFIEAECTDIKAMEKIFEKAGHIDGVIDFAASKAVNESVRKPLLYYRNNLVTLLNLLELKHHHRAVATVGSRVVDKQHAVLEVVVLRVAIYWELGC